MSLLNQVLRDLDARRASDLERQQVPANVKPLPPATTGSLELSRRWLAIALLLVVTLIAFVVFQKLRSPQAAASVMAENPVTTSLMVPIETPAVSATHELKLDMSSLSLKVPDAVVAGSKPDAETVVDRKAVERKAAERKATAMEEPPSTASLQKASPPKEDVGKVIISAQPGAHDEAEYRRALSLIEHGQKAEAAAALRQILGTDPEYHAARQSLFKLLAASGQQDDAATLLADGLRQNPANTQWAMNLARLQVERGDNAGAWETLKRTLPNATNQADYRAFCGTVLQRLNQTTEAASHYQAALRINPTEGRWWVGYALSLEADNKSTESREAFSRAQATGTLPPDLAAFVEGKLRK